MEASCPLGPRPPRPGGLAVTEGGWFDAGAAHHRPRLNKKPSPGCLRRGTGEGFPDRPFGRGSADRRQQVMEVITGDDKRLPTCGSVDAPQKVNDPQVIDAMAGGAYRALSARVEQALVGGVRAPDKRSLRRPIHQAFLSEKGGKDRERRVMIARRWAGPEPVVDVPVLLVRS